MCSILKAMSTVVLVLALITAGLSAAYYDDCDDDCYDDCCDDCSDHCYDGQFMSDPESCCHYYVCDHGRPVRFVCGEGTYYSPNLQTCDHQWNVDCGTRSTEGCRRYNDGGPNKDYNNDQFDNNGQYDKNGHYDNNDQYDNNDTNDLFYNNGYDTNEIYYDENDPFEDEHWTWTDGGTMFNPENDPFEDEHWTWTDGGTMYNPLQTEWGPNSDMPKENQDAYEMRKGSKTIDDTHVVNNYYDRGGPKIGMVMYDHDHDHDRNRKVCD